MDSNKSGAPTRIVRVYVLLKLSVTKQSTNNSAIVGNGGGEVVRATVLSSNLPGARAFFSCSSSYGSVLHQVPQERCFFAVIPISYNNLNCVAWGKAGLINTEWGSKQSGIKKHLSPNWDWYSPASRIPVRTWYDGAGFSSQTATGSAARRWRRRRRPSGSGWKS